MVGMSRTTGAAIDGLEHITQSVRDILGTPIGTRVGRRDYGSDVPELIDHPLIGANILRLYLPWAIDPAPPRSCWRAIEPTSPRLPPAPVSPFPCPSKIRSRPWPSSMESPSPKSPPAPAR
jgi:hypothetical protein